MSKTGILASVVIFLQLMFCAMSCSMQEYEHPCNDLVCQNGGTATLDFGNCTCECPEGYQGELCEEMIRCTENPDFCLNGGVCTNGECDCPEGFSGDSCQFVLDVDGNQYRTVTIGPQVWLTSDLKTTKCNDGTSIPEVQGVMEWKEIDGPKLCWYDNNKMLQLEMGYAPLYNGYAVSDCDICPKGWHVPSSEDWFTLTGNIGGAHFVGPVMKEIGIVHWLESNDDATNESGWTALPGGLRRPFFNAEFLQQGTSGYWWTSTLQAEDHLLARALSRESSVLSIGSNHMAGGFSVRCIKDE